MKSSLISLSNSLQQLAKSFDSIVNDLPEDPVRKWKLSVPFLTNLGDCSYTSPDGLNLMYWDQAAAARWPGSTWDAGSNDVILLSKEKPEGITLLCSYLNSGDATWSEPVEKRYEWEDLGLVDDRDLKIASLEQEIRALNAGIDAVQGQ